MGVLLALAVIAVVAVPIFIISFMKDESGMIRQVHQPFPRAWAHNTLALPHLVNRILGSSSPSSPPCR